jgi:hypothetical protein
MTVFTQSLWAFVSATVIITSTTREQMLIGRILNYVYVVSTLVPLISNDQSQCGVGLKWNSPSFQSTRRRSCLQLCGVSPWGRISCRL